MIMIAFRLEGKAENVKKIGSDARYGKDRHGDPVKFLN